jgi:hypothetical protein
MKINFSLDDFGLDDLCVSCQLQRGVGVYCHRCCSFQWQMVTRITTDDAVLIVEIRCKCGNKNTISFRLESTPEEKEFKGAPVDQEEKYIGEIRKRLFKKLMELPRSWRRPGPEEGQKGKE